MLNLEFSSEAIYTTSAEAAGVQPGFLVAVRGSRCVPDLG